MSLTSPLGVQGPYNNATGTTLGAVDGTLAAFGTIGEIVSATGTSVSVAANTNVDTCHIDFTAGNWLLFSNSVWNAATLSAPLQFLVFYGTAAGNNQTGIDSVKGASVDPVGPTVATGKNQIIIPAFYSFTTDTTIYLKAFCALTSGTNVVDSYFLAMRLGPPQIGV